MSLTQKRNLLPKKVCEGVALTHLLSQHQLQRLRGLKKLPKVSKFSIISKLTLGALLAFYFATYQPTFSFPPVRQNVALAEGAEQQTIDAGKLSSPFQLPHPGYISQRFYSWHPGTDIATGLGMPIHPVNSGKVVEVVYGLWGLGHYVVIEHEQGFRSTYGHMGRVFVKVDDSVNLNSILGEVGMTGRTSGPHTHLEVTKNGKYIDPETVLPKLPDWPTSAGFAPQGQGQVKTEAKQPAPTAAPKEEKKTLQTGFEYFKQSNTSTEVKPLPLLASQLARF